MQEGETRLRGSSSSKQGYSLTRMSRNVFQLLIFGMFGPLSLILFLLSRSHLAFSSSFLTLSSHFNPETRFNQFGWTPGNFKSSYSNPDLFFFSFFSTQDKNISCLFSFSSNDEETKINLAATSAMPSGDPGPPFTNLENEPDFKEAVLVA